MMRALSISTLSPPALATACHSEAMTFPDRAKAAAKAERIGEMRIETL
jgi:hypothetical protein